MPNLAVAPADVDHNGNPITSLGKSLLNSISKIIALVLSIEIERENFIEFGCYLYRASPVIMELMTSKNATSNLTEILENLSKSVDLAKSLISNCSPEAGPVGDAELQSTFEHLESTIRNIGEGLNSIPSSTFRDQYVDVAAKSISREMREAQFPVNGDQTSKPHKEHELENNFSDVSMLVRRDTDLYPGRIEDSIEGSSTDMPRLVDFLRGMVYNSHGNSNNGGQSLKTLPQVAEYMEPLYDTFFCPLTKRVMEDPVTIESGITYERRVITEWFRRSEEGAEDIICPMTGQRLISRALSTNIALKTTIDEWKERNENARIKVARAALTLGSSKSMIFEALKDLQQLCRTSQNKANVHNTGIVSILVRYLEYRDRKIRRETMETLRVLVEDDEHGKEIIANTNAIETAMKMLSSDHHSERHAAVSFLLELSKSQTLCERIGSVAGGILMLITMKLGDSADAFTAEKAGEILKNLEQYPENIKFMAENGLLEPLLRNLIEGSEEMQMEMGSYLGDIVLNDDTKQYVAERASASLIKMVHSGNTLTRKSAFKALTQISSHRSNAKTLVESGIVPIMIEELFTRRIYNEPMNSDLEAASILANILELGVILDPDALQVNSRGHRMASDYVVYNIVHMLHNSSPEELNTSLVRILSSLTRSPDATTRIVSVIKENDMSHALIELLNSPKEELNIACAKLLTTLSPHIGHTISDRLCRTRGQPESLIEKLERTQITEKHAIFTNFLAKLPYQNLTLNLALLEKNTVTTVLQRFNEVQRGETRTSRFTRPYLEGLVGILVRFTATLYDPQILKMARAHNLTSVFTELLISTAGSDEVQRLAAVGLENLSSESVNLSKIPQEIQVKKSFLQRIFSGCFTIHPTEEYKLMVCPIHRGVCSSHETFCLLDAKAVERLIGCLESENSKVVGAALAAIITLLDQRVDVDKSVVLLSEANAVRRVLGALKDHLEESVRRRSLWVIEQFLMRGREGSVVFDDISRDRSLPSTLVRAFHHGEGNTRQMAERILRHLNRMPGFSNKVVL